MPLVIPCKECRWQDPEVRVLEIQSDGIVYHVRCFHCKWEGEVKFSALYQTKVQSQHLREIGDREKG